MDITPHWVSASVEKRQTNIYNDAMTDVYVLSNQFSLKASLWNNKAVLPYNLITSWITCTSLNQNIYRDN